MQFAPVLGYSPYFAIQTFGNRSHRLAGEHHPTGRTIRFQAFDDTVRTQHRTAG